MQKVIRSLRDRAKAMLPSVAKDRAVLIWCLVGATIVWLFSRLSNEVSVSRQISVEYRLQRGLAQTNLVSPTLSVTVKATGWTLLYDAFVPYEKPLSLEADSIGRWYYQRDALLSRVQPLICEGCKVTDIQPTEISFTVEPELTRSLPLNMVLIRRFDKGVFATSEPKIVPSHVRIKGPASKLKQLIHWDLDTLRLFSVGDKQAELSLHPPAQKGALILIDTGVVRLDAPAELFTQKKVVVDVNPINMAGHVSFFPRRVTVSFMVALSSYTQVDASDFAIEADFNQIQTNANQTILPLRIAKKPTFVRNVRCAPENISFVFKE